MRGYAQNLIFEMERNGNLSPKTFDFMVDTFSGKGYLWMIAPFRRKALRRKLSDLFEKVRSGEASGAYWPHSDLGGSDEERKAL